MYSTHGILPEHFEVKYKYCIYAYAINFWLVRFLVSLIEIRLSLQRRVFKFPLQKCLYIYTLRAIAINI